MKKCLLILILFSYSIASFGVSLNYFYCCGKLKTVTIHETAEASKCTGDKKKDCCKNKKVHIQLKTDQQHSPTNDFNCSAPLALPTVFDNVLLSCNNFQQVEKIIVNNKPPSISSVATNILFCTFRI